MISGWWRPGDRRTRAREKKRSEISLSPPSSVLVHLAECIAYEYLYRILFIHYWEIVLTRYTDDEQLQYYHWSRNENSQDDQCSNIKETRKGQQPCVASRNLSRARSEQQKRRKRDSEQNPTISKNTITFIWLSPLDRKQWKENEKTSSSMSISRSWLEIGSFRHLHTYPWSVPQHEGMMKSIQT